MRYNSDEKIVNGVRAMKSNGNAEHRGGSNGKETGNGMLQTGRDECGRYAAGNGGGPGRPKAQIEGQYLVTLSETVSLDDWREITEKAVHQAKHGDHRGDQKSGQK